MEVAGSSSIQVLIYQMTQHHTTERCNPESEELLRTIRIRPDAVTENDNQIIGHSLQKYIYLVW